MSAGLKANADGSAAIQVGGSDAITITSGLNTTFAGTIAVTGSTTALYPLVSGTAVTASGTSVNFTDIPATAKRITVMFSGVSTSGSSAIQIQLGTSGGIQITGYLGSYGYGQTPSTNLTSGFGIYNDTSTDVCHGSLTLSLLNSSTGIWTFSSLLGWSSRAYQLLSAGSKTLSGTLDRVRITTVNGTDTFDAGSINIMWE